jgi:hypothetical protein
MGDLRFVRLLTASGAFEAKLIAARLGSEGMLWELRPGVDGPYPIGPVGVYVEADRYAEAVELITGVPAADGVPAGD